MKPRVDVALAARLLAMSAVASVAAAVPAVVAGLATYAVVMSGASESDAWAELGALVVAMIVGVGTGVIAYVAGIVVGARRLLPPGRRVRSAVAVGALPFVALAALTIPAELAGQTSYEWVAAAAAIVITAAAIAALALAAGVLERHAALTVLVPLAVVGAVLVVTTVVASDAADRAEKREAIRRLGTLPLVEGKRLDEPFPGWSLDAVRYSEYRRSIDLHWDVSETPPADAHMEISDTGVEIRVHAGAESRQLEEDLRSRLVYVPAERFIQACGRRC